MEVEKEIIKRVEQKLAPEFFKFMKRRLALFAVILGFIFAFKGRDLMPSGNSADNQRDTVTYTLEMDALTQDEKVISFNVLYTVSFENKILEGLEIKDNKELNGNLIAPIVRSHIRNAVLKMENDALIHFPTEDYKSGLKKELQGYGFDLIRFVATKRKE